jgi:hypothetical protein
MKLQLRNSKMRVDFSALLTIVGILTVGALAKTAMATQLFHFVR